MSKGWLFAIIGSVVGVMILGSLFIMFLMFSAGGKSNFLDSRGAIGLIRIEGVISGTDSSGGLLGSSGTVTPERVIKQLRQAKNNPEVKAILLRVNSPGGTAAASEEIYREVSRVNEDKPVVVSVSDINASGAYYISAGASHIVASPASEVGSIGTIIQLINLEGLFEKLGIEYEVITQGKYKDLGSPNRSITDEERQILEQQSELIYDRFIADVAEGRGMDEGDVRELATGITYPGLEAIELGLIDELGNFSDAVGVAGQMGNISGEPRILDYREDPFSDVLSQLLFQDGLGISSILDGLKREAVAPVFR